MEPGPGEPGAKADRGTGQAADAGAPLVEQVYRQLRAMARQRLAEERPGHTLQATALVHEAYLRLEKAGVSWSSPAIYYLAAAEAMRRILIEHARRRVARKRGGGLRVLDLDGVLDLAAADDVEQIVSLDGAVMRLESQAPLAGAVVRLRFYAGLSVDQTADALGVSSRTVNREWRFGRAWLYRALEDEVGGGAER
jgi:RNA polymerase sigma factor (TIGR02999 family)